MYNHTMGVSSLDSQLLSTCLSNFYQPLLLSFLPPLLLQMRNANADQFVDVHATVRPEGQAFLFEHQSVQRATGSQSYQRASYDVSRDLKYVDSRKIQSQIFFQKITCQDGFHHRRSENLRNYNTYKYSRLHELLYTKTNVACSYRSCRILNQ